MKDPCLNKHGADPLSREAWQTIKDSISETELGILAEIDLAGTEGLTLIELAGRRHVSPNRISGRITALKKAGLIVRTGSRISPETNCRCAVYQPTTQGLTALEKHLYAQSR